MAGILLITSAFIFRDSECLQTCATNVLSDVNEADAMAKESVFVKASLSKGLDLEVVDLPRLGGRIVNTEPVDLSQRFT
jgi:hypothetical protein